MTLAQGVFRHHRLDDERLKENAISDVDFIIDVSAVNLRYVRARRFASHIVSRRQGKMGASVIQFFGIAAAIRQSDEIFSTGSRESLRYDAKWQYAS